MSIFDEDIKQIAEYVTGLKDKGLQVREFFCQELSETLAENLPIQVGPEANPGIILRGDTFVEMGNPSAGSVSLFLWTDNSSLITDNKITLLGPDIQESPGACLPFAQIIIAGGEKFREKDHEKLAIAPHVSDQIEGYMVRSSSTNMWSRVSKDAAKKGLSFETLGKALFSIFMSNIPYTQAMEIIFITSAKEDVLQLNNLTKKVKEISQDIVKETWKAKGYDLDCDYNCESCMDESTCDSIREVIAEHRKKTKETDTATD
jgi:CO dehydrogenase/acetyl-CoA synthase beta subunit